jgi:hypothetical protein
MSDSIFSIIGTLLGGGRIGGLTLSQIVAAAGVLKDNEQQIEQIAKLVAPIPSSLRKPG